MKLPTSPRSILLDFDGVIVDSVAIKARGFHYAYPEATPEQIVAIDTYQHAHGGVSRREKFRHFEKALFGREPTPEAIEVLSDRFRTAVLDKVMACAFIAGAEDFLATTADRTKLHLISGTPQDELQDIVRKRDLARHFREVIGAPTLKQAAFAQLLEADGHAPEQAVAVGDSTTEYDAACALGIPFVAIVAEGETSPFPAGVPTLPDLKGLAAMLGLR
jgi:phosphoglycolate phosphatase